MKRLSTPMTEQIQALSLPFSQTGLKERIADGGKKGILKPDEHKGDAQLPPTNQRVLTNKIHCTNCHGVLPSYAHFCGICGQSLRSVSKDSQYADVPKKGKDRVQVAQVPESKGMARIALTAFFAILRRDIRVTSRNGMSFLVQVLLEPLFFLFIFGRVLPHIGVAAQNFAATLLPGIVALTIVTTAFQSVTLPLVLDLGFAHEIEDRLLAPIPVSWVAIEKILFAALRGLITGTIVFPLAFLTLGSEFQMRSDALGILISMMIFTAFAGATLGLTIGTLVKQEQLGLMFSLVFTPLIFTGCTFYPWSSLRSIKWFQIITLINPLTYASEGLRYAMVPDSHGYQLPTLGLPWEILGLCITILVFLVLGMSTFYRRVVS